MRHLLASAAVSALVITGITPIAAHAGPTPTTVTCGQTVTTNLRLTNDLLDCPGSGLVVGADHVRIDLAGHTIDGTNAPGSDGIAVDGHDHVQIRGGTVTGFFVSGVALRSAPHSSVTNLRVTDIGAGGVEGDASAGVLVKDSPRTSVSRVSVSNDVEAYQSDGIDVIGSARTEVRGSSLTKNSYNGLVVDLSPDVSIAGNRFEANRNNGVQVNAGSDRVELTANRSNGNSLVGAIVGVSANARIEGNTFTDNSDTGLLMFDLTDGRVSGNRASGNGTGIVLFGGQFGSTGNRLVDNRATHNSTGILLEGGANANTLAGNVASDNDGIPGEGGGLIVAGSSDNTIRGNVASRNLDVGIGVFDDQPGDGAGNVLRYNTADHNGAHGMDVVTGTVDGGGNRARHNTPLPNCVGIVCS